MCFLFAAFSLGWADVDKTTLEKRIIRSCESLDNVMGGKGGPIPSSIMDKAQGIIILREYGAGFWFGGKGGLGLAMERSRNGQWGPPAFLKIGEGSFGLQIGVQRLDLVFLFMNRESLRVFEKPKFRLGVDAAAAAGPLGANAEAKAGAPILVYTDTQGLYAGASFEGAILLPDPDANEAFYGKGITLPQILAGQGVRSPGVAQSLKERLDNISGRGGGMY